MARISAVSCVIVLLGWAPVAMAADQGASVLDESDDIIVMSVTPRDADVKPRMESIADMRYTGQPATAVPPSASSNLASSRDFLAGARATD